MHQPSEALTNFFEKNSSNEILTNVGDYVLKGEQVSWDRLAKQKIPSYASPIERIPTHWIRPGEDRIYDRVYAVKASFLGPFEVGEWIGNIDRGVHRRGWFSKLVSLVPSERRVEFLGNVVLYARKADRLNKPNDVGEYLLSQSAADLVGLVQKVVATDPSVLGLVGTFLSFWAEHQREMLADHWREFLGKGDLEKYGDRIALSLYCVGIEETLPAVLSGLDQCRSAFTRFLILKSLHKTNPDTHRERTHAAALNGLNGEVGILAAEWLAEHVPEEAVTKISEAIRGADSQGSWSNWGMIARRSLEILGEDGIPIIEACADTEDCDTVLGGASGAIRGGVRPPDERIRRMLKRILAVGDPHWSGLALTEIARWDLEGFHEEIEACCQDADPKIRNLGRMVALEGRLREYEGDDVTQMAIRMSSVFNDPKGKGLLECLRPHVVPCLHLTAEKLDETMQRADFSHFGGIPDFGSEFEWPLDSNGVMLSFLARINGAEIQRSEPSYDGGDLLFFADWRNALGAIRQLDTRGGEFAIEQEQGIYSFRGMKVRSESCIPYGCQWEAWRFSDLQDSEEGLEWSGFALSAFSGERLGSEATIHRAFGAPFSVQSSPKAEAADCLEPRTTAPTPEEDWVSVLSVQSDEEVGISFHDTGTMSFLIPALDWKAQRFDRLYLYIDYC